MQSISVPGDIQAGILTERIKRAGFRIISYRLDELAPLLPKDTEKQPYAAYLSAYTANVGLGVFSEIDLYKGFACLDSRLPIVHKLLRKPIFNIVDIHMRIDYAIQTQFA